MDENPDPEIPLEGVEVKSTTAFGPVPVGDADLLPLIGRLIAAISSAALNLLNGASGKTDELGSARRLCALAAVDAAGELRALTILCTTGLPMFGRIHLRSIDDCMRRLAVYFNDRAFAVTTESTLPDFQADGFSKLTDDDRARIAAREDDFAARFDALMAAKNPPLQITKHASYKSKPAVGLDEFTRWAYSQVEHCTPIALAEISNRLSLTSEQIYATDESVQLLVAAIGITLNILAHLAALGVAVKDEYHALEDRLAAILERSGLNGPAEDDSPTGPASAEAL